MAGPTRRDPSSPRNARTFLAFRQRDGIVEPLKPAAESLCLKRLLRRVGRLGSVKLVTECRVVVVVRLRRKLSDDVRRQSEDVLQAVPDRLQPDDSHAEGGSRPHTCCMKPSLTKRWSSTTAARTPPAEWAKWWSTSSACPPHSPPASRPVTSLSSSYPLPSLASDSASCSAKSTILTRSLLTCKLGIGPATFGKRNRRLMTKSSLRHRLFAWPLHRRKGEGRPWQPSARWRVADAEDTRACTGLPGGWTDSAKQTVPSLMIARLEDTTTSATQCHTPPTPRSAPPPPAAPAAVGCRRRPCDALVTEPVSLGYRLKVRACRGRAGVGVLLLRPQWGGGRRRTHT